MEAAAGMAVSKADDKAGARAKAIWTFGLMTRFARKLDARRANRALPLEKLKTITTSIAYSCRTSRPARSASARLRRSGNAYRRADDWNLAASRPASRSTINLSVATARYNMLD